MVDKVIDYGYEKIGFILDRGYFSKENIQYIDRNGYTFIIMCKGRKGPVSSLVLEVQGSFETNRSDLIRALQGIRNHCEIPSFEDDTRDRYFHIYYSPSSQAAERERLEQMIEKMRQFLERRVGRDEKFGKTYQTYFHLHYDRKGDFPGCRGKIRSY